MAWTKPASDDSYFAGMRRLHMERSISKSTREALRSLESHRFHGFNFAGDWGLSYQTCRFCKRGHPDVLGLWKYGVRHYACDDCRNAAIAKAEGLH